jgi:hypothetical protein
MPIWLRKYTFIKLKNFFKEKSEAENKQMNPNTKKLFDPNNPVPKQFQKKSSYK